MKMGGKPLEIYRLNKLLFIILITLATFLGSLNTSIQHPGNSILLVNINGEITGATTNMIKEALGIGEINQVRLAIVTLNTPGGEVTAVKEIMDIFEQSNIPICVFVYPPTATAWSGGTYLLMASHIAVMASGTTIGSCQPVYSTGEPIDYSKYINAFIALMRDHARLHGRNETAAELFVKENINMGPEEAYKNHVIELIADDVNSLLAKLEDYSLIQMTNVYGTLLWRLLPNDELSNVKAIRIISFEDISKAEKIEYTPGIGIAVQNFLYNPLISSLLLTLGLFILFIGLHTPGYGAEIVGVICLILGLIGLGAIGITTSSIILFTLGFLLIIAELKTHIGLLAMIGSVCLVIGGLMLFPSPQWLLYYEITERIRQIILGVSIFVAAFFSILVYKIAKARKRRIATGEEALIGAIGKVTRNLNPKGEIRVHGEYWQAMVEEGSVKKGELVKVVGRVGMTLIVKPVEEKV